MAVAIPRSSPLYLASASISAAVALAVIAFVAVKYQKVVLFMLHPVFMVLGVALMSMGILEQGSGGGKVHVWLQQGAALSFFLGWLFMYLQHEKAGVSHFAAKSPWWHKVHVYLGYTLVILWIVQIAGGVMKYGNLPTKSVKWHGILGQIMYALKLPMFLLAAVMSLWSSSGPQYLTEGLFMTGFVGMHGLVLGTFWKYKLEQSKGDSGGAGEDDGAGLDNPYGTSEDGETRPLGSVVVGRSGAGGRSPDTSI
ncbi:unnamed protein product [Amoebophrya sp. A25]|nr:unnamed protein product [Amoebophrya sp. A25]|eukprot:GSA25T00017170001.1